MYLGPASPHETHQVQLHTEITLQFFVDNEHQRNKVPSQFHNYLICLLHACIEWKISYLSSELHDVNCEL